MPAATSEWQSSSRTPHASCVAPHASLVPSHASPCSPFVTGLVDKCEAAMAATDALCASAAAGVGAARAGAASRRQYVFSGELVRGTQFYGYCEDETVFVRMSVFRAPHVTRHAAR
jgi:hypothetical protein